MASTTRTRLIVCSIAIAFAVQHSQADPIVDFFERLGNSASRAKRAESTRRGSQKSSSRRATEKDASRGKPNPTLQPSTGAPPQTSPAPTAVATASPAAPPSVVLTVRAATAVAPSATVRRDIPYAVPVPTKPGLVTSPYAPNQGYVDVRAFPSGSEVRDPYTGKIFLTP